MLVLSFTAFDPKETWGEPLLDHFVGARALAVLRLMTNLYLVGACTGRSAGLSPLRIRST
jgi:hypothetical protein